MEWEAWITKGSPDVKSGSRLKRQDLLVVGKEVQGAGLVPMVIQAPPPGVYKIVFVLESQFMPVIFRCGVFIFLFTFFIPSPFSVLADFDLTHWAFSRDFTPPEIITQNKFFELRLDNEIFSKARADLADLRIIRDDGLETPYTFETVSLSGSSNQPNIPIRLINQEYVGNDATVITADLGRSGISHSGLTLTTSGKNFHREVLIEGSNDNQTWVKFEASRFIYDEALKSSLRNTTIDYPDVTFRYLRVIIYDRGEPRLIIAGALARHSGTPSETKAPQKLIFRYEPGHTYQFYFGRADARQVEYDLTSFTPYLNSHDRQVVTLNPTINNPQFIPPPARIPFSERFPYLLVGMLILTVGVVGGLTFRLFKQTHV